MKIFTQINDKDLHLKYEFYGEYALESWILALTEIYYGKEISELIKNALKSRIAEEKLKENLNCLAIKAHFIQTRRY